MQIDIELVGKTNRWSYQQPRIRIGRDPSCDVSLPGNEYPMVSREHLVLEVTAAGVTLSDTRSANGTFLNGSRVTAGIVAAGDTLRLGGDGPELRIHLKEGADWQTASSRPPDSDRTQVVGSQATLATAVGSATVLHAGAAEGATQVDRSGTVFSAPGQQGSDKGTGVRVSVGAPSQAESRPAAPVSAAPPPANPELEPGVEIVIERKLNLMRNLLAVNLIGMLILLFALFYQGQQIAKNKEAVANLQKNAESAVKQFTPALDSRLSEFEKRVDGMDAKMQQAQDRFMDQMKRQTPVILDAYFNRKMEELKRQGLR
jgi:pSer/pThr/pTyr-binding forkhead associated (FHA) protein